jgi:hypothetical protein
MVDRRHDEVVLNAKRDTLRELSAVPVAVVVSAIVLAVLVGIWDGPWPAAIATVGFALLVIAGLVVWSTRRADPLAGDAPHVRTVDDGRLRILLVVDERSMASGLVEALRSRARVRPISVFVTAPALESRIGRLAGDQNGYDDANRRLRDTLDALHEVGLQARGVIGPSEPLQAADDGLRQFPADEIVFVTAPEGQANWLEQGVVAMAGARYDQPVKHLGVS